MHILEQYYVNNITFITGGNNMQNYFVKFAH